MSDWDEAGDPAVSLAESHLVVGFRALLGVVSSRVEAGWFEYGMSD